MRSDNVIDMENFRMNLMEKLKTNSAFTLLILVVVFAIISKFVLIVGAGERVVVFNSITGVEKNVKGEGLHLLIPFIQTPFVYDVKTHSYTMSSIQENNNYRSQNGSSIEALTSDGQKIKIDISVIYNLIPGKVALLHQEIGRDFHNRVLKPQVRSIVRSIVASYPVLDLYSEKRLSVQKDIQEKVKAALENYYINVPEVLIRTVTFSDEFAKAVEQKQVALQEAERMKYVLQKEEREKQRKIIEASGEAEAIKRKAAALRANPQLIQYEYVTKLSPGIRTIITDQKTIMNFSNDLFKGK